MTAQLYYLHGKDSSPAGFRSEYLRERFPDIVVPALEPDVLKRRAVIEPLIGDEAVIIGSSLGGMSALDFAMRFPEKVKAMVLLAPAVDFFNPQWRSPEVMAFVSSLVVPANIPTVVIAGREDEVIPFEAMEVLIQRSPQPENIRFEPVDDNHRLRSQAALDFMTEAARQFLA